MEYLIIIAAVLIVAAVTTMLVTGTVGEQREDVLIEQCRSAATQCELQRRGDPDADCDFCEEQCVDQEGEEIFEGAIDCCKLGMDEEIYIGSDGCGDLIEVTADFSHDPLNPTAGSEVEFTDQSTVNHPDYDIVDWEWDFGDGGTSSQQNPTHTYDSEGTYTVELQVWDEEGNTDTTQETLEVSEYVYLETDYEGEGEIDVDPPDIEGRYEAGTEITLTAEPYELEDYYLYEWKDAEGSTTECIGEDETCTFTIEENSEITAVFIDEYAVNFTEEKTYIEVDIEEKETISFWARNEDEEWTHYAVSGGTQYVNGEQQQFDNTYYLEEEGKLKIGIYRFDD